MYINTQGSARKLRNKIFILVVPGWKDYGVLYVFLYLLKFILLEDVAFIRPKKKNVGCKNRINKDNLGGSQLCALYTRLCLKISWTYNSLQILRVSGHFLPSSPALHIESLFSSCWIVTSITSLPACFSNLPFVFPLTCWGLTNTLVLSKAWHLVAT